MSSDTESQTRQEEWRAVLLGTNPGLYRGRSIFRLIPSSPRCMICNMPFSGIGGLLMHLLGRDPYLKNPNICNACLTKEEIGGVEVELTMLFADVRGSTSLAEKSSPAEFTRLMQRFYDAASRVLIDSMALVDKLVGDEVIGLFIPGFAGSDHARRGVNTARELLRATGHADPGGPWLPVGVGVHTGIAYVGLVGNPHGFSDLTALGDSMNIAARLASAAGPGEALISEAALGASGLDMPSAERRELELKGKSEKVGVRVIGV